MSEKNNKNDQSEINPLGEFSGLKSIEKLDDGADVVRVFQETLIDKPVGEYFRKYIKTGMKAPANLNEQLVAIKKIWLADFHRWIMANCDKTTCEHMDELLKAESDWDSLRIAYNSFKQDSAVGMEQLGKDLLPNLSHLETGVISGAQEWWQLVENLEQSSYHRYLVMLPEPYDDDYLTGEETTIDDCQKVDLSRRYSLAYQKQSHYGTFYAYFKLKEIEIQNLFWLATIFGVFPRSHRAWTKYVPFEVIEDEDAE